MNILKTSVTCKLLEPWHLSLILVDSTDCPQIMCPKYCKMPSFQVPLLCKVHGRQHMPVTPLYKSQSTFEDTERKWVMLKLSDIKACIPTLVYWFWSQIIFYRLQGGCSGSNPRIPSCSYPESKNVYSVLEASATYRSISVTHGVTRSSWNNVSWGANLRLIKPNGEDAFGSGSRMNFAGNQCIQGRLGILRNWMIVALQ